KIEFVPEKSISEIFRFNVPDSISKRLTDAELAINVSPLIIILPVLEDCINILDISAVLKSNMISISIFSERENNVLVPKDLRVEIFNFNVEFSVEFTRFPFVISTYIDSN